MLRALRHRNYRLFFIGQSISMLGSWMQATALGLLVYELTHSTVLLGVVTFASQIPAFFLAPFAGVLADRFDRRKMVMATQSLAMLQAAVLAALTLAGAVQPWHVIALGLVAGVAMAFDVPTRQAFVLEMLDDRADLPNAIALNSFLINGSKLVGPAIAGLLIYVVNQVASGRHGGPLVLGEGVCFGLNAVSYLAVLGSLVAMRITPLARPHRHPAVLASLREGWRYSIDHKPILAALALLAMVSLAGFSYLTLLPALAKDVLRDPFGLRDPHEMVNGFLMAAAGLGAVGGAIWLASRRSVRGVSKFIAGGPAVFGAALLAASFTEYWPAAVLMMIPAGLGTMLQVLSTNTLLQTVVDDDKRGRVMSLYTMCFMGMGPFGGLLVGWLAEQIGVRWAIRVGAAVCIAAALAFMAWLPRHNRLVAAMLEHKKTGSAGVVADEGIE